MTDEEYEIEEDYTVLGEEEYQLDDLLQAQKELHPCRKPLQCMKDQWRRLQDAPH